MKSLLSFLLVLSFGVYSHAGINKVGKGGGFAEMLALKTDRSLAKYLSACLVQPQICNLTEATRATTVSLVKNLSALQKIDIEFTPTCDNKVTVKTSHLEIPSCFLYVITDGKTEMKSFTDISFVVLAARAFQAGISELETVPLKQIFSSFKLSDSTSVLPLGRNKVVLHFTTVASHYYNNDLSLSVETPADTTDITSLLKERLCGEDKLKTFEIRFERNLMLNPQRFLFESNIWWECHYPVNAKFKAKIAISGLLNEKLSIAEKSLSVQIKQKEQLW